MDENLKHQFDSLCTEFGMNATTAFNIFARAVVREKRIPFEIKASDDALKRDGMKVFSELREQAKQNGIQDMTLEDINEEISKVRRGEADV
ncbi:MAG: type II toxin-antitoxin system RelB/DinJ family antitoxin [Clostridiales bacterium]|nr:type II toxin-antitoxin system RelB/DinJ family antitoxin [Clostridiales bacterium]